MEKENNQFYDSIIVNKNIDRKPLIEKIRKEILEIVNQKPSGQEILAGDDSQKVRVLKIAESMVEYLNQRKNLPSGITSVRIDRAVMKQAIIGNAVGQYHDIDAVIFEQAWVYVAEEIETI